MSFSRAVERLPKIRAVYSTGLGALGSNRTRVHASNPRLILGSLNIEAAQRRIDPRSNTWDYGVGVASDRRELIVWIEVHPANALHVQIIIDKLDSLRSFLCRHAEQLQAFEPRYVWLATRGVAIRPGSQERRRLDGRGIMLRAQRLQLESVL